MSGIFEFTYVRIICVVKQFRSIKILNVMHLHDYKINFTENFTAIYIVITCYFNRNLIAFKYCRVVTNIVTYLQYNMIAEFQKNI